MNQDSKWTYLPQWNVLQLHWPNGNIRYEVDLDRTEMDWVDHLSSKRWMTPELMADLERKIERHS
ncbi:MAG TPA: hypothetical protein VFE69_03585 [Ilumatobacteraceae bacterium]|nr:hypothetical protein [Ilumatobacteraceae bacterium]